MAGNCIEPGLSVTSKISLILLAFTRGQEHNITQVAHLTGLPISTSHRLIGELASRRLLERTASGAYRAGLPLRSMGAAHHRTPALQERAPLVVEDLATVTKMRVRLGVLQDTRVAYIEGKPGHVPVTQFSAAATVPLTPTAIGRVLLAFSPPAVIEATIKRGLPRFTPHTITSAVQMRRKLTATRLTQVAVARFEFEATLCGVAMPVFGPGGAVVAAMEVATDDTGHDLRSTLPALAIATRSLSRELLGAGGPEQAGVSTERWAGESGEDRWAAAAASSGPVQPVTRRAWG